MISRAVITIATKACKTNMANTKRSSNYFTPSEVLLHSTANDLWVSFLGKVYDLTVLCEKHNGSPLLKPILNSGGKDISHWFDKKTNDIRYHIHPKTNCLVPNTPLGRFVHVPPPCPRSDWANDFGRPWWKDAFYCIGTLSQKTRRIRIVNTLTSQEQTIEVCSEETLNEILDRYVVYNRHATSYTWKFNGHCLDMNATLEDNGIKDQSKEMYNLSINEDLYLPVIHLYFNDDLTEA